RPLQGNPGRRLQDADREPARGVRGDPGPKGPAGLEDPQRRLILHGLSEVRQALTSPNESAARPRFFPSAERDSMKNLQEATERICELKGSLVALDALVPALIEALPPSARESMLAAFEARAEAARTVLLHADISDVVLATF